MGNIEKRTSYEYPTELDDIFDSVEIGYNEEYDYSDNEDSEECIYVSRDSIKDFMISITVHPRLIADILHVTHVLLSALDLLSRCHDINTYHLERKIKRLSISSDIDNLTEEDLQQIAQDDSRERSERNGRIEYLDSVYEEGDQMMYTLDYLINVELKDLYGKHPELGPNIRYQINQQAIAVFAVVAKGFGYSVSVNQNKLY